MPMLRGFLLRISFSQMLIKWIEIKIMNWMKMLCDDLFINLVQTNHRICTKENHFLSLKTSTDEKAENDCR